MVIMKWSKGLNICVYRDEISISNVEINNSIRPNDIYL